MLLLAGFVTMSCGESWPATKAPPAEQFEARGQISAIAGSSLDIHHERMPAIRTFEGTLAPMDSMTMPFATNGVSIEGLAKGDIVSFAFTVHYDADPTLRLTRIVKLPADTRLVLP